MAVRKVETFPPVTMGHIRGHGCRDLLVSAVQGDAITAQPRTLIGCPTKRRCGRYVGGWSAPDAG
jgi:hypothetical protein